MQHRCMPPPNAPVEIIKADAWLSEHPQRFSLAGEFASTSLDNKPNVLHRNRSSFSKRYCGSAQFDKTLRKIEKRTSYKKDTFRKYSSKIIAILTGTLLSFAGMDSQTIA